MSVDDCFGFNRDETFPSAILLFLISVSNVWNVDAGRGPLLQKADKNAEEKRKNLKKLGLTMAHLHTMHHGRSLFHNPGLFEGGT